MIYNCQGSGIYTGTPGSSVIGAVSSSLYNNTLFRNNRQTTGPVTTGEICVFENTRNTFAYNNIVYASPVDAYISVDNYGGATSVFSAFNLYFTTGTSLWLWNGNAVNDLATWQTYVTQENTSTAGTDPLLADTSALSPDLHITAASPAKNAGINSTNAGTLDIDGQARTAGTIDKGADELQ